MSPRFEYAVIASGWAWVAAIMGGIFYLLLNWPW